MPFAFWKVVKVDGCVRNYLCKQGRNKSSRNLPPSSSEHGKSQGAGAKHGSRYRHGVAREQSDGVGECAHIKLTLLEGQLFNSCQ